MFIKNNEAIMYSVTCRLAHYGYLKLFLRLKSGVGGFDIGKKRVPKFYSRGKETRFGRHVVKDK